MPKAEYKNVKVRLESLGDIELKYISARDIKDFLGHRSDDSLSDRQFVAKILHHQLVTPRLGLEEFERVSDQELSVAAKAFIAAEGSIFESYKESEDAFRSFRLALKHNLDRHAQQMEKMVEPFKKEAEEALRRIHGTVGSLERLVPNLILKEPRVLVPGSLEVTREENNWQRHSELLNSLDASLTIQGKILEEQQGNTKLVKWTIVIALATLLVALATLCPGAE